MPVAGIAVVIGITAMDLYDACEDMKDMDQLMSLVSMSDDLDTDKVCGLKFPTQNEPLRSLSLCGN